jgi:hypothetical protein
LAEVVGYYSAPSQCPVLEDNKPVPCDDTDWLQIDQVDAMHAKFHVYSDQTNSSQCDVEGVATWDGHSLKYVHSDPQSFAFGYGFRIVFANGEITFQYLPQSGPRKYVRPFCGAQASLETVEFSLHEP